MSNRLQDKVALITGTGGGQGRDAAIRFAAEGALVVGCDVKVEGNAETKRIVEAAGGKITTMEPVDLGDSARATEWVQAAGAVHGRIDILYNNASAARFAPIESFSDEDWHFTIRNELDLVFYVTRASWPWLKKSRGVILNTASTAGTAGSGFGGAGHASTKGAVIALTKHLAQEGASHGMRVNCISPGFIVTPGTAFIHERKELLDAMVAGTLVGCVGKPRDVVTLAVHLCSDDASFITGSNFIVDGGAVLSNGFHIKD